ncbi:MULTISPECIES: hypothetical protein [Dictyoglomus]|nr:MULTISPECIES: hypothetical protein [Dictyoglomus]
MFWDFDIEHMYDLEHVWVYIKGNWHGKYRNFEEFQVIDGHPVIYAQPGKHSFASVKEYFNGDLFNYLRTIISCKFFAGKSGILQKGYNIELKRGDEEFKKEIPERISYLLTNIRENFNFPLTYSYSNLIIH